jgi:hypothetical protein
VEEAEARDGLRAAAAEGGSVEGSSVPWGPLSGGALVSTKQQLKKSLTPYGGREPEIESQR